MMVEVLEQREAGGIHHLVMNDGPNALTPELMTALSDAVTGLRDHGAPPVLLTSSHDSVFCPGWNLKRLAGADRSDVAAFLGRFNQLIRNLFSYPGPTGAAINGHAVAGGCLLALCCDIRIMAAGGPRIGMSELNLGVPVPAPSLTMLGTRLSADIVEEMVVRGDGLTADRANTLGIIHRLAEPERVVADTERELARVASKPARAFAVTKRFLLGDSWRRMAEPDPSADAEFLDCWFSDETQSRIVNLVERISR
jgi:enoyl-CoA hydratase